MLNVLLSFLYGFILLQELPVNDSTLNHGDKTYQISWLLQEKVEYTDEQLIIDFSTYSAENTYLEILSSEPFYIFSSGSLIGEANTNKISLSLDSLRNQLASDSLFIYSTSSRGQLNYGFYKKAQISNYPVFVKEIDVIENNERHNKDNFMIGLIIIFLILLSVLKVSFPKKFQDVFSLSGAFSTRPAEGDNLRLRLFEQDGLFVALVYTFSMAIIIYLYISLNDTAFYDQGSVNYLSFFQSWLFIIVLLIVKISVIFFLSGLYKSSRINIFYIKELINISLLFVTILLISTILIFLYIGELPEYWEVVGKNTVLILYLIRMGLLYFKILKLSGFTYLYLFSYFCATEIFPFVIGLKYFY